MHFVLQEWKNTYHKASTALQFRERKLEDAAQQIENKLMLLGATAIEDKLQDEVNIYFLFLIFLLLGFSLLFYWFLIVFSL